MSLSETLRKKGLVLRDTLGIGMTTPVDNRVHLDAAIAWLKLAQDVTGNGGVAHFTAAFQPAWRAALRRAAATCQESMRSGEAAIEQGRFQPPDHDAITTA